jgi:signal transduction histidine kinase
MLADLRLLLVGFATALVATVTWSTTLILFPVAGPVWRAVSDLDRRNAAAWLGRPVVGGRRAGTDFAWLVLHGMVGTTFGGVAIALVAGVLGALAAPAWWWALPDIEWSVEPWLLVPLAVPLAALGFVLVRSMAWVEAHFAEALLGGGTAGDVPTRAPYDAELWLSRHASLAALIGFVNTLLWGLTGGGYFWPIWVWLGLGISLGLHAAAAGRVSKPQVQVGIGTVCLIVWALTGMSYFWPVWPILGMATWYVAERLWSRRVLADRVDELTRTRSGALDVQAAELRRIERDLHDGAQARLVALSMQLGRAEERLGDQPEVAELVRQARGEASAAIAELRDLARGIAPPVLADRGLGAAIESLARRAPVPTTVDVRLERRLPAVIETAAYFVVAEALTNVAKHAPTATARVSAALEAGRLVVEVDDDGRGGADLDGGGITGLRHRVEALDGVLAVVSTAGEGTMIRAEIPCGS